jgi:hypothetical protein
MTEVIGQQAEDEFPSTWNLAVLSALGATFKWVIASLLLVNGGALVALLNTPGAGSILQVSGKFFIAGAMAAVWAGINAGGAMMGLVNPRVFATDKKTRFKPRSKPHQLMTTICLGLSLVMMIGSVFAFTFGAFAVGEAMENLDRKASEVPADLMRPSN